MYAKSSFPYKLTGLNVASYVDPNVYAKDKSDIDPDLVVRKTKEGEVVMEATHLLSVMTPGQDLNLDEVPLCGSKEKSPAPGEPVSIEDAEVEVTARWYPPEVKPVKTDSKANIFGTYGTFELVNTPPTLELPAVWLENISDTDLQKYHAKRLTPDCPKYKHFNTFGKDLFSIVYNYKDYLQKYALKEDLGGGWFIEHHDFPQFFKPMSTECSGAVILGRLVSVDKDTNIGHYKFVSIKMKYPDALAIESDVIHGNSSFEGPWAISSTTAGKASIALMRTTDSAIQQVSQADYQTQRFFKTHPKGLVSPGDPQKSMDAVNKIVVSGGSNCTLS
ncbi:hypothetical protein [Legionella waltersii]|uniref:Uncharacterized protein n=1 Tax=Legionella waltersii TaxID=66969 RepID=A0A0W1A1N6_9GAMM|nr:hypothetical protein [Legionella waltersii]KTD75298.1 hypothetical protein Lwal_3339 [Legionella waltersii]SNV07002.1 Uncharacterised protein [Legionella waltersii]